jgi:hypothetical protein
MNAAAATGLFSLAGTVLGGLATLLGHRINLRHEHRRAEVARREQRGELRRRACVDLMTRLDHLHERARDLCASIEGSPSTDARRATYDSYLDSWRALVDGLAPVQIAGPAALSQSAVDLYDAAAAYSTAVDDHHAGKEWTRSSAQAEARMHQARRNFAETARSTLGFDGD